MKKFSMILCLSMVITLLSGCATSLVTAVNPMTVYREETDNRRLKPQLYVNFLAENMPIKHVQVMTAHTSWLAYDGDGNFIFGEIADSLPPLMLWESAFDYATLFLEGINGKFELLFDYHYPPDYVSVTRWNVRYSAIYVDNHDELAENITGRAEHVDIDNGIFLFNNDGQDYIYSIFAEWLSDSPGNSLGRLTFTFRVNSGGYPELSNAPVNVQPEQPLHGLDIASEWASESITRAHSLGLIPTSLFAFPTFTDYTLPTTRAEFAALAVALYEVTTSREITGRMEFNDTSDINVQKMGYLGVLTGVGGGNFAPDDILTREQAAVILVRLINTIPQIMPQVTLSPEYLAITDISSWAVQYVHSLIAAGIMTGMGDGTFAPQDYFTRERSIVTIMRVYDFIS